MLNTVHLKSGGTIGRGRPVETSHTSSGLCSFNLVLVISRQVKAVL